MQNKPLVSIIVPVYNVEPYLRQCLDSIIAQTYTAFEVVLVDDGSTDQSGVICDEYAARDSRFVVVHKQNEGVAKARITAFEQSKGELITFIDSDDYVSSDYLEKLSKPIIESNADIVSSDYYKVRNGQNIETPAKLTGTYVDEEIKEFIAHHYFYDKATDGYGMTIFLCTKMVKRLFVLEALEQGKDMWYAEDQIAVFYMLLRCKKLVLLPDRMYFYVQREGQARKNYSFSLWENLFLLMEKYQTLDKDNITEKGRNYRIWLHIEKTIRYKMKKANLSKNEFCSHLSKMRYHPYMQSFFHQFTTGCGWKDDAKFWLLKLGMIRCYYSLYVSRHSKK